MKGKGAEIAQTFGFNVKGTAAVLALFERDRITEEGARVLIERCRRELRFRITDKIINQVLEKYGIE